MTTSDYKKMLKQLVTKPAKLEKFKKHNFPRLRKFGRSMNKCKNCGRMGAHVGKYKINLCRQCFRETAKKIGFKKYI